MPTLLSKPISAVHAEQKRFDDFSSFETFTRATYQHWALELQRALRLIALNGIIDPISGSCIPATALKVDGHNFRETLEHDGLVARQRAVLLCLQELLADGSLPPQEQLEIYCPEAVTPFAQCLRTQFPHALCSEFLPDPSDPMRDLVPHQDLCALTLAEASVDLVLCNELFEHLYDLPSALSEIHRIQRPGGWLISTCPLAYDRYESIIKARHRDGATPGVAAEAELLTEPEFHGDPVAPEQGSLVYQIPGWELLDQARAAGLTDVHFRWLAAPSYGVVGQEIPAVIVMIARR
jgi:SAM-dependent methyltransferase